MGIEEEEEKKEEEMELLPRGDIAPVQSTFDVAKSKKFHHIENVSLRSNRTGRQRNLY